MVLGTRRSLAGIKDTCHHAQGIEHFVYILSYLYIYNEISLGWDPSLYIEFTYMFHINHIYMS